MTSTVFTHEHTKPSLTWQARLLGNQAFWVTLAIGLIFIAMSIISEPFTRTSNLYNITRNLSFIGLMALGQTAVIITGGIDLSVGSIMALSIIVGGIQLEAGAPLWVGLPITLLVAAAAGLFNGVLIAKLKLSPFVVTLAMMTLARSLGQVITNNSMILNFGPDQDWFKWLGGSSTLGVANPVWVLLIAMLIFGYVFNFTAWGRHLYAIGGNENAARLTGVPVDRVKISVYVISAVMAGIAGTLLSSWQGSFNAQLGQSYELRVIASTVIGGANLMGGEGTAYGAVIGAVLLEIVRNALVLAKVNTLWEGFVIGCFILFAVLLERVRDPRFSLLGWLRGR